MDSSYRHALAAGAALLVSHGGSETASAATDFRTTTSSQSGESIDVLFAPVADATELVSVSDGSVYTGEGASLVVSAITDGNQIIPLTGSISGGFAVTRSLFDMTLDDFTAFPAQAIKGIRFSMAGAKRLLWFGDDSQRNPIYLHDPGAANSAVSWSRPLGARCSRGSPFALNFFADLMAKEFVFRTLRTSRSARARFPRRTQARP